VEQEVLHGQTSLEGNISGPFPEAPGKDGLHGTENTSSETSGEVVVGSDLDFSVSVGGEPFFG